MIFLETGGFFFLENLGFGVKGQEAFSPEENKHVDDNNGNCY